MFLNHKERKEKAFTLIELLVVIAILAVLAVAVTLILNPAELIRQGRDSIRLSDLATINKALGLYQTDQIAQWMGTSTIVYTSLPDTDSTCSSYGLPSLPSGWTYNCETTTTYTNVDGTGWLPVNFTSMSFSSPLARLPVDPVNNATSSKYYTYVSGGSWELSAVMEAVSNKLGGDNDRVSGDGGDSYSFYELGSDVNLSPINDDGLVGYWSLDEDDSSGTTINDLSGNGNNGTSANTPIFTTDSNGQSNRAMSFDGSSDYVNCGSGSGLNFETGNFTLEIWVKTETGANVILRKGGGYSTGSPGYSIAGGTTSNLQISGPTKVILNGNPGGYLTIGEWNCLVYTINRNGYVKKYINGALTGQTDISADAAVDMSTGASLYLSFLFQKFKGLIDDVRIYNRALSAAEIEVIYNSY